MAFSLHKFIKMVTFSLMNTKGVNIHILAEMNKELKPILDECLKENKQYGFMDFEILKDLFTERKFILKKYKATEIGDCLETLKAHNQWLVFKRG